MHPERKSETDTGLCEMPQVLPDKGWKKEFKVKEVEEGVSLHVRKTAWNKIKAWTETGLGGWVQILAREIKSWVYWGYWNKIKAWTERGGMSVGGRVERRS